MKMTKISAGQKAAKTRIKNYLKASAEEKARIDEIRHQAAVKANQTRRFGKQHQLRKSLQILIVLNYILIVV